MWIQRFHTQIHIRIIINIHNRSSYFTIITCTITSFTHSACQNLSLRVKPMVVLVVMSTLAELVIITTAWGEGVRVVNRGNLIGPNVS